MKLLGKVTVVVLSVWAIYFTLSPVHALFWSGPGDFGVTADSSMRVIVVDPDSAAKRAGLRVGDRFAPTTSFENRLYLQYWHNPPAEKTIALQVEGEGGSRAVEIVADPQAYDASIITYYFVAAVTNLLFILVGASLVLLRPSRMTWAFFIFSIGTAPWYVLGAYYLPEWLIFANGVFYGALGSLALGAFLVFCVRVPRDRATGGWHYLESVGAPVVVALLLLCNAVIDLSIVGVLHRESVARPLLALVEAATYLVGIAALAATFLTERGADRRRVGIIVGGLMIGLGASVLNRVMDGNGNSFTGASLPYDDPFWLVFTWYAIQMLQVAIPLSVAYAVVRYHALNLGLFANRTLVYGLFLCAGFAAFSLFDLLLTKQFARNQFEVGLDIAVALAIGLSFQFWHPRTLRLIDRIFLPDRYRATIALDDLREMLSVIRGDDAPNRAVEAIAKELRLSSLAVFKRTPDGGFVRYAAAGWPKGSAWHVYAADSLARSFGNGARIRPLDDTQTAGLNVSAEYRPQMGILLSPHTPTESLILVGAHVGGRRPDRDEVRGVAALLHDFVRIGIVRNGRASPASPIRSAL